MSPVEALTCPKCGGNVSENDKNCPACGVSIRVLPGYGTIYFGMPEHGAILDKAKKALKLEPEKLGLGKDSLNLVRIHIKNMKLLLEEIALFGIHAPIYLFNQVGHEITQVEGIGVAL